MDISQKIGICMLVWTLTSFFILIITEDKNRGKYALVFWSTFVSVAVYLIL